MAQPQDYLAKGGTRRLTSQQNAATHFQCTVRTIRNWIGAGHIRGYRVAPRKIVVDLNEIEAMLRTGRVRDPRKTYGAASQIIDMTHVVLPAQESDR